MRTLIPLLILTAACGEMKKVVDAGPDTSCGFDCAAQARFGLIQNRCFEYSSDPTTKTDPPALGAWVRTMTTLEGGVQVLPVEYRAGGQILAVDNFAIKNGDLWLMRRQFIRDGQSVTYKTGSAITGVKWFSLGSAAGENASTDADAFVVGSSGTGTTTATSYQVSTSMPSVSELKTPLLTYSDGVKVLVGETPDHGSDTRRIWVPDTGFTLISSSFSIAGGTALPYLLQRVRDPGTPDGGAADCSLGSP